MVKLQGSKQVAKLAEFLEGQGCKVHVDGLTVQIVTPSGMNGYVSYLRGGAYQEILRDGEAVLENNYRNFAELKAAWLYGWQGAL